MDMMAEHAEGLAVQRMFPDAVEMVQRRLRRPADAERAMHMGLRPVEYGAQFVPIAYRFERKLLHRRPGDDEAVEPLVPHVAPRPVEGRHRSEEHTSELQSLMRISYAVFCLNKKTHNQELTIQNK